MFTTLCAISSFAATIFPRNRFLGISSFLLCFTLSLMMWIITTYFVLWFVCALQLASQTLKRYYWLSLYFLHTTNSLSKLWQINYYWLLTPLLDCVMCNHHFSPLRVLFKKKPSEIPREHTWVNWIWKVKATNKNLFFISVLVGYLSLVFVHTDAMTRICTFIASG